VIDLLRQLDVTYELSLPVEQATVSLSSCHLCCRVYRPAGSQTTLNDLEKTVVTRFPVYVKLRDVVTSDSEFKKKLDVSAEKSRSHSTQETQSHMVRKN